MCKFKLFINKYRHMFAMCGIFLISVAILGWIGYDILPTASTKSERVIVNDDYSQISQPIVDEIGLVQNIVVKGDTKLYGVSLNFHIFNNVQHGTVFVDLLDNRENVIASSQRDMTSILDNTFKTFIFDNVVQSEQDSKYKIHIWAKPETDDDCFALWCSDKTYADFEMVENGTADSGTVALQYIINRVGDSIFGWYKIFALMVVFGLELLYVLVFILKTKTHVTFAFGAIVIGMIFIWFTPINGGPDEYVHLASAYNISNNILGIPKAEDDKLTIRKCDDVVDYNGPVEYDSFSFADMYNGLISHAGDTDDTVTIEARVIDSFKPLHFAQAMGITFARLLKLGFVPMVLMGRLFNLLQYILLICLAIKIIPCFKTTMALIGLLPMSMQVAGNLAYDAYVIGMSFLFIALVFRRAYRKEKVSYKDLAVITVVLCLLAPAKTIYILAGLLIFMLPDEKMPKKGRSVLTKIAIFTVAVICWAGVNFSSVIGTLLPRESRETQSSDKTETVISQNDIQGEYERQVRYPYEEILETEDSTNKEEISSWDPDSDILPNGDSRYYYSVSYILHNVRGTVKLVLHTIMQNTGKYLQTVIGTRLGEIIVVDLQASWIWFIILVALLYLSTISVNGEALIYKKKDKILGLIVFTLVLLRVVAACITWTPINYETIFGIQGRYLLPVLPLLIMALQNDNLIFRKAVDDKLMYLILPTDILVILNVFMIMNKN